MEIIHAQGDKVGCLYDDNPQYTEIHGKPVYKAEIATVAGRVIISIGSCRARRLIAGRYAIEYLLTNFNEYNEVA